MDQAFRELVVHRISAGILRCRLNDDYEEGKPPFLLIPPSPEDRYQAQEIFVYAHEQALEAGLYAAGDLEAFMTAHGFWDEGRQKTLDGIEKDIEDLKVRLFSAENRPIELVATRKLLAAARDKALHLRGEKHSHDSLGADAFARAARARCLIARCLRSSSGDCLVGVKEEYLQSRSTLLADIAAYASAAAITETQFRELAREEPWASIWATRKTCDSLFGVPAVRLSDEQRTLIAWSTRYDNIREHQDCPSDEVLADDDMLDGWTILKCRERDVETGKRRAEGLLKGPGSDAQEVFVPVGSPKEAQMVESLNGPQAAAAKKSRYATIDRLGIARDDQLPDVQQQLRMEAVRMGKV